MELSALDGFLAGDSVVLAHPTLYEVYGDKKVKFSIESVRIYEDTVKCIRYTSYILKVPDGMAPLKVLIAETNGFYSLLLMTMFHHGRHNEEDSSADRSNGGFGSIIGQSRGIPDCILLSDGGIKVKWLSDGETMSGMALHIDETNIVEASVREYYSEENINGINRAILVCHGEERNCNLEMWAGFYIMDHNVELVEEE